MTFLWVALALVALAVVAAIGIYNGLVASRNQVKNAWSQIDVQLKRRYDLIPNLVETAKGYMKHERETLERIAEARSRAMGTRSVAEKSAAETVLSGEMARFFALAENYPDLKANRNFLALQEELTSTENRVSFSRQNYNDQVLFYNNKLQMFPSNLVAGAFGFAPESAFTIEDASQKEAPKVNFS
jgi:LemA protein